MNFLWKKIRHITAVMTALKDDETGIFVPNRQLSWIVSTVLLFGFLSFITGYFWGQRKAIERFVNKIEEESFADRISYALYTMNDREASEFEDDDTAVVNPEAVENNTADGIEAADNGESENGSQAAVLVQAEELPASSIIKDIPIAVSEPIIEKKQEATNIFVAPLAGFGTLHAARIFVERVSKYCPSIHIKTHHSKTRKGRSIAWYQAVTGEFDDRDDIERIVKQVKEREHIKEIQIIEKRKVVRA